MGTLILILRVAALLGALLLCMPVHLPYRMLGKTSPVAPWYLRTAGRIAGLRVRRNGTPAKGAILFVANHRSWLDILVLGGDTGAPFVAKSEIARWPMIGWLARQMDTLFVARGERGAVRAQAGEVEARLAAGRPVSLFPEGSTSRDGVLLPFRPSLMQAAVATGAAVQPVAIAYGCADRVEWPDDEPAGHNARRILSGRAPIPVTVTYLPPITADDRKLLAGRAHEAVATVLAASGTDPLAV